MKHIEVSKKIVVNKKTTIQELRNALVERLERALDIEKISDGIDEFTFSGTTGSPASMTRHAYLELTARIEFENDIARIMISGYSRSARSLMIMYSTLFLLMLLVGLLPGSVQTSADKSAALDALVFLVLGIFIVFDVNKKLEEPKAFLETALESLNTAFG